MNREIKFRVFETEKARGRMFDWSEIKNDFIDYLNCSETFVMQFTGLKDKNGIEIYEGDILRSIPNSCLIIFYHDGSAAFCVKYPNDEDYFRSVSNAETSTHLEIIGNIHENPELLSLN